MCMLLPEPQRPPRSAVIVIADRGVLFTPTSLRLHHLAGLR